jgi:hypothetical protein
METLSQMSLLGLLTLFLTLAPLVMAIVYVIRPTEHRLALMRPLSLAGLFASLTGTALGFINVFKYFGEKRDVAADAYNVAFIGAAESLVMLFVGFGCLTVAWLLVAAGMGRQRS